MKHVVIFSGSEVEAVLAGKQANIVRFYKKKPEFLNKLSVGDVIFFRKSRGEVLGQFCIGKLIIIESLDVGDWSWIKGIVNHEAGIKNYGKETFEEKIRENSILVIIQIEKLEQFITSPIDVPKSKKEWVVL